MRVKRHLTSQNSNFKSSGTPIGELPNDSDRLTNPSTDALHAGRARLRINRRSVGGKRPRITRALTRRVPFLRHRPDVPSLLMLPGAPRRDRWVGTLSRRILNRDTTGAGRMAGSGNEARGDREGSSAIFPPRGPGRSKSRVWNNCSTLRPVISLLSLRDDRSRQSVARYNFSPITSRLTRECRERHSIYAHGDAISPRDWAYCVPASSGRSRECFHDGSYWKTAQDLIRAPRSWISVNFRSARRFLRAANLKSLVVTDSREMASKWPF